MYLGQIVELAAASELRDQPLHPYTRALWSAEPLLSRSNAGRNRKRIVLQGEIPSPMQPPSGCRFRTRCPEARDICAREAPVWREPTPGHRIACHFDLH
jgi:peptide/nickel transport system ATP-binding protein/oligopeptide transport system ATP-binding protein